MSIRLKSCRNLLSTRTNFFLFSNNGVILWFCFSTTPRTYEPVRKVYSAVSKGKLKQHFYSDRSYDGWTKRTLFIEAKPWC